MDLSEQLKAARKEAGLTQEQAAEELGVTRQTISNWENGRTWPDIASVVRMSERYSVSLDRLLKGESGTVSRYVAYLEESTGVVKSRERLIRVVAWAATLLLWAAAQLCFWLLPGGEPIRMCGILFRVVLLPLAAALSTAALAGTGRLRRLWVLPAVFALLFALVPHVSWISFDQTAIRSFRWPDLAYLPVGALSSLAGLGLRYLHGRRRTAKDPANGSEGGES